MILDGISITSYCFGYFRHAHCLCKYIIQHFRHKNNRHIIHTFDQILNKIVYDMPIYDKTRLWYDVCVGITQNNRLKEAFLMKKKIIGAAIAGVLLVGGVGMVFAIQGQGRDATPEVPSCCVDECSASAITPRFILPGRDDKPGEVDEKPKG